jgi:hypothetical protein
VPLRRFPLSIYVLARYSLNSITFPLGGMFACQVRVEHALSQLVHVSNSIIGIILGEPTWRSVERLATGWTTERSEFGLGMANNSLPSLSSGEVPRTTHPPTQWTMGLFPGGKAAGI